MYTGAFLYVRYSFLLISNKFCYLLSVYCTGRCSGRYRDVGGHNTENFKQIFPEKELRDLNLNFHIHVSVSDLYIPRIGLTILLQENMGTDPGNI